jgi:hypothetical protein
MDVMGGINHNQLKTTTLKQKKKKQVLTGKELEAHQIEKGCLSCDSDTPQVRGARSDSAGVVKVNHHVMNCHKTRRYCSLETIR